MDIEKLASYLKNEEIMDSSAMSDTMHLLEKHPYFQIGHMLLLRAMQNIQPENYNKQLKISGSFISDKKKLFEFINKPLPIKKEETVVEKKEEKKEVKDAFEKKEVKSITKTLPHKQESDNVEKEVEEKVEAENKNVDTVSDKNENQDKKETVKTVDPEIKHEKIVKDFFHQQKVSYSGADKSKGSQKEDGQEGQKIEEVDAGINKGTIKVEKKEAEVVDARQLIEAKKAAARKKRESLTKEKTIEKTVEVKKEVVKKSESSSIKTEEKGGMNDIFSKIRKIKKEMNVEPETGIKKEIEPKKTETVKPKEKKSVGGRVIKESFIGFEENKEEGAKTEELNVAETVKKETPIEEKKEEIKESELTAKDLFRKHKLKQETAIKTENLSAERKENVVEPEQKEQASNKSVHVEEKKDATNEVAKEESAADALLKRISAKKERMRQEKVQEEAEKELAKKKELEEIEKIIQESKKKEETLTETESVENIKKEEAESIKESAEEVIKKEEIIEEPVAKKNGAKTKKSINLIDSFIEKADSLERIGSKDSKLTGDISLSSAVETEEIMTETYADLLIQQKKYQKAIDVYNKLILKYPEKKTYFAIQIKKVESLIK